jgi:hypothetical protein
MSSLNRNHRSSLGLSGSSQTYRWIVRRPRRKGPSFCASFGALEFGDGNLEDVVCSSPLIPTVAWLFEVIVEYRISAQSHRALTSRRHMVYNIHILQWGFMVPSTAMPIAQSAPFFHHSSALPQAIEFKLHGVYSGHVKSVARCRPSRRASISGPC